jgi:hypothetical protein
MVSRTSGGNLNIISLRFPNIIKREKWAELPWPAPKPRAVGGPPLVLAAYAHEDDVIEGEQKPPF